MDGDKMMIDAEGSLKLVPAVMRAAQILDQIARATQEGGKRSGEGMKLSELARQTALPKSSVHGLCQTLVHLKLLKLNGDAVSAWGRNRYAGPMSFWRKAILSRHSTRLWRRR
ncbi:hypothetical protein BGC10_13500 [Brucella abortus]|nr:hypothetical protein CK801_11650 [Brucella abortus]ODJ47327.1 hypothetical protein BGC10_13500 [Brucella abortus]RUQ67629.1 hypothetical protein ELZ23_14960 [Brucella abortus]